MVMMVSPTENLQQENEFFRRALKESLADNAKLATINAKLQAELDELRLKMAEGLSEYAHFDGGVKVFESRDPRLPNNATLVLNERC